MIDVRPEPKKILVINDTQEILDLFRDIFEEEGYEVVLQSFAVNDLMEVKRVRPDLIILDYMIGGEDYGWQSLQKLKMDRETATIPVIICTGAVRQVRELEGHLKAKGVGIVLKPFDIDDLLHEVNVCWASLEEDAKHP
jgi:CheY-like chemotaxis protein